MEIGVPGIGPHGKNEPFRGTPRAGGTLMGIFSTFSPRWAERWRAAAAAAPQRFTVSVAEGYFTIKTDAF